MFICTCLYTDASAWVQAIISICTSWLSIGMGLKGIVLLKDLLPYQTKQMKKIKALQAQLGGDGTVLIEHETAAILTDAQPLQMI